LGKIVRRVGRWQEYPAVIPSKNARDSMAMLAMLRRGNAHANWHRALWGDSRALKKVK
jgi:hypothetical protein